MNLNINLKTSTKISIKFTIFTILIIFLFGLAVNVFFFNIRYMDGVNLTRNFNKQQLYNKITLGRDRGRLVDIFEAGGVQDYSLQQHIIWKNISKVEDFYFMSHRLGDSIIVHEITLYIKLQLRLINISIMLMMIFGIATYFISKLFVKISLQKLKKLVDHSNSLNIETLNNKFEIVGHPQDEINLVGNKLNKSLDKIHKQTIALKDFVTNASHELKTPLMSISTEIDVANKTFEYKNALFNIKKTIKKINSILNILTMLTQIENNTELPKENENINKIIDNIVVDMSSKYSYKKIILDRDMLENIIINTNKDAIEIILKNILENAYKYTPIGGKIYIKGDLNHIEIKDSGIGIDIKNIDRVREKFWQEDSSKSDENSFGLGLHIVKKLIEILGLQINIQSQKNIGTSFIIYFDKK